MTLGLIITRYYRAANERLNNIFCQFNVRKLTTDFENTGLEILMTLSDGAKM